MAVSTRSGSRVHATGVEPLRDELEAAQAASTLREKAGDEVGACAEVERFYRRLCSVRVLDPACGTGNFLYVTLDHLKRLEGEVADTLAQFPGQTTLDTTRGLTVSLGQLLGVECGAAVRLDPSVPSCSGGPSVQGDRLQSRVRVL